MQSWGLQNFANPFIPFSVFQFFFGNNKAYPFGMTQGLPASIVPITGYDVDKDKLIPNMITILRAIKRKKNWKPKDEAELELYKQALIQELIYYEGNTIKLTQDGNDYVESFIRLPDLSLPVAAGEL